MKPLPFEYHAPETLAEALDLLSEHGDEAKVLAGGQSLVPLLNFHLARPAHLVDINRIPGLDRFGFEDGWLEVGCLVRHAALETPPAGFEPLAAVAALIGHPAIRNRGTVVGSLAHADPAAEWPSAFTAWPGAEVVAASRRGRRTIALAELFVSHFGTLLEPDELLLQLRLPPLPAGHTFGFAEFSRRHGDFALAAAAVVAGTDGVRAALGGVGPIPVLLYNLPVEGEAAGIRALVSAALRPTGDVHASADYRRELAAEMVVRALHRAA